MEIVKREHENGMYRTDVYFLAKNIAEIPLAVLQPGKWTNLFENMAADTMMIEIHCIDWHKPIHRDFHFNILCKL